MTETFASSVIWFDPSNSPSKFVLEVMSQFFYRGEGKLVLRLAQRLTIQPIIVSPVFKLFTYLTAHSDLQRVRFNRQVAQIEKFVKVTSQQEAVGQGKVKPSDE